MKKMLFIKKLQNNVKTTEEIKNPLSIYDIRTNTSELLYTPEERVEMRMSGIYGNFERVEFYNQYGVKFHKTKSVF